MKVDLRLLAVGFSLTILTACSTVGDWFAEESYEEPPEPLTEFASEFSPRVLWDKGVNSGVDEKKLDLASWWQNNKIFAVDHEGEVTALNAETGREIWDADLDFSVVTGIGGGMEAVYIGSDKGLLVALSEADGKELWRTQLTSEVLAPATSANGIVVSRTSDGRVTGISADDGSVIWSYQRAVPLLSLRGAGRPVIAGDAVIAGYDNGKLVALTLNDGKVIWEKSIAIPRGRTELERLVDIDADPVVINDSVYVVTYQGQLAAVDINSGRVSWSRDMSSQIGLDADYANAVYVTDDQGYVWAVQDGSGDALWRQTRLLRRQVTAPAIAGNYIVVGDFEGYLHWIARDDGRFVSRQQLSDGPIYSKPLVINGIVYVTAADGSITAVRVPEN
jgi:outer membrane protein assembly factor BamB